ncbi:PorT family protein [Aquimarina sp. ERC-38]|uniref:porin family protein n=1 Tax=Aquimarina sp. ERC-38 TaxID=2949996 RepID=UPI0022452537|nr:porin family protein [Aquimarina sp. ERC-38]UZO79676.1 PorT family protein [Aquimarina sp. ERC-38]
MKKIILVTLVFISCTHLAQAQDLKFGVKGGLNFAQINVDDGEFGPDTESKTGYHIGLVSQFSLLGMFAVQPELLYSAQGAKDFDLDYLNIPILFKYKVAGIVSIEAGPQFGFLVNDNIADDFTNPELENFDLSGAIGAGVEFSDFFAQIRYNFGLSDSVEGVDSKNNIFQVSVGYYIF